MTEHPEIDQLDKKILAILMADGKTPYTDIAKELFVSSGTIHVRMKKLEGLGIVGPAEGSKPREVLYYDSMELERYLTEIKARR